MSKQRITAIVLVAVAVIAGVVIFAAAGDGGDGRKASIGADTTGLSINDVSVVEGNSGTTQAVFTISRVDTSVVSSVAWDANVRRDAPAPAGREDFSSAGGTVSLAVGQASNTVSVPVYGDTVGEQDEIFEVNLSSPSGATIVGGTGIGTIDNDDPGFKVDDVSVDEGNVGTKALTFTVTRTGPTTSAVSVGYATVDASATAGSDYKGGSRTLSFEAGQATRAVSATIIGDTTMEPKETFQLKLSGSSGPPIIDATGVGTIANDDATLSIDDASVVEGNSGSKPATFTVTRFGRTSGAAQVDWATANGTATASNDYNSASGTLSFLAGETTKTLSVSVLGDTLLEPDEAFNVELSEPSGASINDDTGVGAIVSDDLPALSIRDVSVPEGNAGTKPAVFTISRNDTTVASSVSWAALDPKSNTLANKASTSDFDSQAAGTVSFAVGEASKTVSVAVTGDTIDEPDEPFTVNLSSPVQAAIADGAGIGTILDDDPPPLRIADAEVTEGTSGSRAMTFTITRGGTAEGTSSVNWATTNGTATTGTAAATPGTDYTAASGAVTFAPDETSKTVSVTVRGDTTIELNETFNVVLTTPVGAQITEGTAVGTILSDDLPGLSINNVTRTEHDLFDDPVPMVFTITRTDTSVPSSVFWRVGELTVSPGDFAGGGRGTETFAVGEASKTVTVFIYGDNVHESNEQFSVFLTKPVGATIIDGEGIGTIDDDDPEEPPHSGRL
jgi:hypothetical protein